jgi:hypothetical protein
MEIGLIDKKRKVIKSQRKIAVPFLNLFFEDLWVNRSRKERSAFSPPGSRHRLADYFRPDSRFLNVS